MSTIDLAKSLNTTLGEASTLYNVASAPKQDSIDDENDILAFTEIKPVSPRIVDGVMWENGISEFSKYVKDHPFKTHFTPVNKTVKAERESTLAERSFMNMEEYLAWGDAVKISPVTNCLEVNCTTTSYYSVPLTWKFNTTLKDNLDWDNLVEPSNIRTIHYNRILKSKLDISVNFTGPGEKYIWFVPLVHEVVGVLYINVYDIKGATLYYSQVVPLTIQIPLKSDSGYLEGVYGLLSA